MGGWRLGSQESAWILVPLYFAYGSDMTAGQLSGRRSLRITITFTSSLTARAIGDCWRNTFDYSRR